MSNLVKFHQYICIFLRFYCNFIFLYFYKDLTWNHNFLFDQVTKKNQIALKSSKTAYMLIKLYQIAHFYNLEVQIKLFFKNLNFWTPHEEFKILKIAYILIKLYQIAHFSSPYVNKESIFKNWNVWTPTKNFWFFRDFVTI